MAAAKSAVLLANALNGSTVRALDLLGKTYCHWAVPTGEHSRRIAIKASHASSLPAVSFCKPVQADRSEKRRFKTSGGKHWFKSFGGSFSSIVGLMATASFSILSANLRNAEASERHLSFARAIRATKGWASRPMLASPAPSPSIIDRKSVV